MSGSSLIEYNVIPWISVWVAFVKIGLPGRALFQGWCLFKKPKNRDKKKFKKGLMTVFFFWINTQFIYKSYTTKKFINQYSKGGVGGIYSGEGGIYLKIWSGRRDAYLRGCLFKKMMVIVHLVFLILNHQQWVFCMDNLEFVVIYNDIFLFSPVISSYLSI